MKIAVVGTGYVGLVTGTCFAETGNTVTCVDIDVNKVTKLMSGEITIYEPGLEKIFLRNLKEERLFFTTKLADGIKDASIIFLALPTPPGEDGSADIRYVLGVAENGSGSIKMPPGLVPPLHTGGKDGWWPLKSHPPRRDDLVVRALLVSADDSH